MNEANSQGMSPRIGGSIVDVRMWLDASPWRIAAGWTVLAGLFASGYALDEIIARITSIALLFLLADPLWGSIWGLMSAPDSLPATQRTPGNSRVWLPYLRSGSPAARLLGTDGPSVLAQIFRGVLPAVLLALVVATLLHPAALWLTLLLVGVSTARWLQSQLPAVMSGLLAGIATVLLPWLLVVLALEDADNTSAQMILAGLWALHLWGAGAAHNPVTQPWGLLGLAGAQLGIGILLIALRLPLWLFFTVLAFLPTWIAIYRRETLERVEVWWLLALLISGLALGQAI